MGCAHTCGLHRGLSAAEQTSRCSMTPSASRGVELTDTASGASSPLTWRRQASRLRGMPACLGGGVVLRRCARCAHPGRDPRRPHRRSHCRGRDRRGPGPGRCGESSGRASGACPECTSTQRPPDPPGNRGLIRLGHAVCNWGAAGPGNGPRAGGVSAHPRPCPGWCRRGVGHRFSSCWVAPARLVGVVVGGDPVGGGGGAVVLVGPGGCYRPGGSDGPADE